jgi:peptide/nickel transport system substrate-binding protein
MSVKEHIWIPKLKQQLSDKLISRREFVRYSTLLGMSAGAAYMWAGKITGEPFAPPARAQDMPKGGTVKVSMRVPKVDNPHTFSWAFDSNIVRQSCGYLTRTGADNVTRPHLASKWEVSPDLKTWTFTIADINWHDGEPFTAEDAAWNIKHCLDPNTGSSVLGLLEAVLLKVTETGEKNDKGEPVKKYELWDANAIESKDPKKLVLNLQTANIGLPESFFHYPFLMLDPKENGTFKVGSRGTGAFSLVEHEEGRKAVVKAVEGRGAHLESVEFIDLGDNPPASAAAVQSQQVHLVYNANVEQLDLYKGMPHIDVVETVTAQTAVARMRLDQKPFDDPKVRKAFRLATENAPVLQIAHKGLGEVAEHHHVARIHPEYFQLPEMKRDVEGAKKLLAEAGFPDGLDTEIVCKPEPTWEQAAVETLVGQWKEAGINCKINLMPSAKFWEVWDKVPFGFTEWTHRPLAIMVLGLAYRTGVPWNESAYSNKQFDELLTKAEGTLDVKARSEIVGELEKILQEDGPIVQPLWRSIIFPVDKKVKGFQGHPTRYFFCEEWAIEQA